MDRMLMVVFDNEDKAIEGSHVLRQLDRDGYVVMYDAAIVVRELRRNDLRQAWR